MILKWIDSLAWIGKYQEKAKLPFSPGLEVSGEIIECNGCKNRHVGDRVYCIFSSSGGYSEECVVDESRCFVIPDVWTIRWIELSLFLLKWYLPWV